MKLRELILLCILAYLLVISGTIGALCYLDYVKCGNTGDTREWLVALIGMVVCLLKGGDSKD